MGILSDEASLIALYLETFFYGIFLTLYLLALFILLRKPGIQRHILIPVATLLLCIETAHLVIGFVRSIEAFVFELPTIIANGYYANPALPSELAKISLYLVQTSLADSVIVWRCYVLNHRSLLVAIPGCIALLTNGAAGFYVIWSLSQTPAGSAVTMIVDNCIATFYTLTMVISVTCTSLIVWRIYRVHYFTPDASHTLLPVIIVIVESGALYATSVLALLVTFLIGSNVQYIMQDVITVIVGIAFCLVILQVHFQVGGKPRIEQPTEPRGNATDLFRGRDRGSRLRPRSSSLT